MQSITSGKFLPGGGSGMPPIGRVPGSVGPIPRPGQGFPPIRRYPMPGPVLGNGGPGQQHLATAIFNALSGGLDQGQIQHMMHGFNPGHEHGMFARFGFNPEQLKTIAQNYLNDAGVMRQGRAQSLWSQILGQTGQNPLLTDQSGGGLHVGGHPGFQVQGGMGGPLGTPIFRGPDGMPQRTPMPLPLQGRMPNPGRIGNLRYQPL